MYLNVNVNLNLNLYLNLHRNAHRHTYTSTQGNIKMNSVEGHNGMKNNAQRIYKN